MTVRWRLNFIALVTLALISIAALGVYQQIEDWRVAEVEIALSFERRSQVIDLIGLEYSNHGAQRLRAIKNSAPDKMVTAAMSDLIQSYNAKNTENLRERLIAYLEAERGFFRTIQKERRAMVSRVLENVILGMVSPFIGILFLMSEIRRKIFKSIDRLSRRMMDFLVDRYSFQFSQPEANELGNLQRTFNSLAQRVINTMEELKSLDQAKSEFLSITSHELRTPLTSIKGSLSILGSGMMGTLDPSCMKLVRVAETETDRLIRLINDLLDLAKIEAGKLPLNCAWRSWGEVALQTVDGLTGLAHNANVRIVADGGDGAEVYIDHDRVHQVLTNLISNAVKFSPQGTSIEVITGRTANGEFLVNVRDQGPGISNEDQDLIFEKFRQGSNPENPIVKGTGLGLAICKALVEEHGGQIGVDSKIGKGSTFWFTLPKWRKIDPQADEQSTTEPPSESAA